MKSLKIILTVIISTLCFTWLCGCSYTQNYTPELNDKQQSIADTINSKYHFESINIAGKKTSGSSGNHNTLLIQFINGVNIPTGDAEKALAKELGQQAIEAIKSPDQFDGYTIGFCTRKVDGAVTTNRYYNYDFTPAELKAK